MIGPAAYFVQSKYASSSFSKAAHGIRCLLVSTVLAGKGLATFSQAVIERPRARWQLIRVKGAATWYEWKRNACGCKCGVCLEVRLARSTAAKGLPGLFSLFYCQTNEERKGHQIFCFKFEVVTFSVFARYGAWAQSRSRDLGK